MYEGEDGAAGEAERKRVEETDQNKGLREENSWRYRR
jgi:hypothetical protein